jgi:hypothetical protein
MVRKDVQYLSADILCKNERFSCQIISKNYHALVDIEIDPKENLKNSDSMTNFHCSLLASMSSRLTTSEQMSLLVIELLATDADNQNIIAFLDMPKNRFINEMNNQLDTFFQDLNEAF